MMNISWSAQEKRLIRKGDLKQLGHDINEHHLRADDPLALVGAPVMAAAATVMKLPNALVGQLSSEEAVPLGEGGFAYTSRDIDSAARNFRATVKNIVTLHPLRAAGNAVKTVFDAADVVTDPLLDVGSGIFGHTQSKTRGRMSKALAGETSYATAA